MSRPLGDLGPRDKVWLFAEVLENHEFRIFAADLARTESVAQADLNLVSAQVSGPVALLRASAGALLNLCDEHLPVYTGGKT